MKYFKKILIIFPIIVTLCACSFSVTFQNDDGGEIIEEPTGEITPSTLSYRFEDLVKHSINNISCTPSIVEEGKSIHALIVPVWLTDSNNYYSASLKDEYKEILRKAYFGTNSEVPWRSVKTYYEELSNGKITFDGEILDFYESTYSVSTVDKNANMAIAQSAVDNWKNGKTTQEKRTLDLNSDGFVDYIAMVYMGPSRNSFSSANPLSQKEDLWAYVYWLQKNTHANTSSPNPNAYMWVPFEMIGTTNIDTHVVIHESGHMFGLEDYYDYSYDSAQYSFAGGFSMQDMNVGCHDPWSVTALGWSNPYIINNNDVGEEGLVLSFNSFQESKDLVLIAPTTNKNSPFDEYIILEYYTPTGLNQQDAYSLYKRNYPQGSTTSGIRLWHVDARLYNGTNNTTTTISNYSNYRLVNTNTYWNNDPDLEDRVSPLANYRDYHLLNLIRHGDSSANKNKGGSRAYFTSSDLFTRGDEFNISNYSGYFINNKFNNGKEFDFNIKITALDLINKTATIKITKNTISE